MFKFKFMHIHKHFLNKSYSYQFSIYNKSGGYKKRSLYRHNHFLNGINEFKNFTNTVLNYKFMT